MRIKQPLIWPCGRGKSKKQSVSQWQIAKINQPIIGGQIDAPNGKDVAF